MNRITSEEFLDRFDNRMEFSEREIEYMVNFHWVEGSQHIEKMNGENRRWSRTNTVITEINGRFFKIEYEEGLTECQEDTYYNQPVEVKLNEFEKTTTYTVRQWLEVKNEINK